MGKIPPSGGNFVSLELFSISWERARKILNYLRMRKFFTISDREKVMLSVLAQ